MSIHVWVTIPIIYTIDVNKNREYLRCDYWCFLLIFITFDEQSTWDLKRIKTLLIYYLQKLLCINNLKI